MAQRGRDSSPVFIVGAARSGTSLLFRSLLQHGRFRTDVVDLVESNFMRSISSSATLDEHAEWGLRAFANGDDGLFDRFYANLTTLAPFRAPLLNAADRWPGERFWTPTALTTTAVRAYVDVATQARHCERLVEKSPFHLKYTRQLLTAFPNGRVIFLLRHPLDTLTSYWRRGNSEPNQEWLHISMEDFCQRWQDEADTALAWATSRPDRFSLIRYEELVADPKTSFTDLCHFLDEPPPTDFGFLDSDPEANRTYVADPLLRGPIVRHSKDWEELISLDDAEEVEERLAATIRAAGYEFQTIRADEAGQVA